MNPGEVYGCSLYSSCNFSVVLIFKIKNWENKGLKKERNVWERQMRDSADLHHNRAMSQGEGASAEPEGREACPESTAKVPALYDGLQTIMVSCAIIALPVTSILCRACQFLSDNHSPSCENDTLN